MNKNSKELVNDVNKSRYGRISQKKKYDEEFQTALKKSCDDIDKSLSPSIKTNRPTSTASNSNHGHILSKINGFVIADIVWAKTGKYPVWPGIIIRDPLSNMISKDTNNCTMLHIYYCNDNFKRNWIKISQIFKFTSKISAFNELPKSYTQITRTLLKAKWNRAVDEAESLAGMSRDNRIEAFFSNNFLPHVRVPLMDTAEVNNSKNKKQKDNVSASTSSPSPTKSYQDINSKSSKSKYNKSANAKITTAPTKSSQGNSAENNTQKVQVNLSAKAKSDIIQQDINSKRSKSKDNKSANAKINTAPTNSFQGNSAENNMQKVEVNLSTKVKSDIIQQDSNSKRSKSKDNKSANAKITTAPTNSSQKRKLSSTDEMYNGSHEKKHKLNDKAYVSDKPHKLSKQINSVSITTNGTSNDNPNEHPRILIPELCKLFYSNGWVTGTGGGISIKYNDQIFIAPSGVQKERMEPEDLFVQDLNGMDIEVPSADKKLSKSQCTPIFMCSYKERNAGAVIHIHSQEAIKLCLLNPENEFLRIRDLEIIKGIFNEEEDKFYDNDEEVIVPIIKNSKHERDLVGKFRKALTNYPMASAVLVRNHGMYVWGKDWKSAKTQCECYEQAFGIMIFKKTHNL